MTTMFLMQPFRYFQSHHARQTPNSGNGKEKEPAISSSHIQSNNIDGSGGLSTPIADRIPWGEKPKDSLTSTLDIQPDNARKGQSAGSSTVLPAQPAIRLETAAGRIKNFLNNSIWPEIASQPRSGDFLSPFDRLDYLPVPVSFAFGFVALFDLLFWSRRCRFSLLLPLAGTFAIGMAYFRLTGYIAAVGFCTMALNSDGRTVGVALIFRRCTWASVSASVLWALALYQAVFTGAVPELIGEPNYVFGLGKIPTYDDRVCDYVRKCYSEKNVFTTVVSGSFALFKWYPGKKVFIDGFFAPHPFSLWKDYKEVTTSQNPDLLHDRYGVELALVEHDRSDWNMTFLNGKSWQPVAIGLGDVLYRYQPNRSSEMPVLFFELPEVGRMPRYFRQTLAYNYYSSIISVAHFTGSTLKCTERDRGIFYGLEPALAPNDRHLFEEAMSHVKFD